MVLKCAASRFFLFFFSALQWRPQCEWGGHSEIARHKFFSQFCLFGGLFPFRVDTKANKLQGSELFPLTKQGILPLCADVQQPYTENLFLLSICCSEINFSFVFFPMGLIFTACIFFQYCELCPSELEKLCQLPYYEIIRIFLESKEEHLASQM